MSHLIPAPKLEEYLKQYDLNKCLAFLRRIFGFNYIKTRGEDGVYIWFGDRDWDYQSKCPTVNLGSCTVIFIDYTEDQVIEKYDRYYKLRAFL